MEYLVHSVRHFLNRGAFFLGKKHLREKIREVRGGVLFDEFVDVLQNFFLFNSEPQIVVEFAGTLLHRTAQNQ